jgi:hypothetical protein
MRSKWMSSSETNRLLYLDRFKIACEKYFRAQPPPASSDAQSHQLLQTFFTSILDLLYYITSSNLDLSIKIKLVLSTCLGWLVKHSQVNYCKKSYKTICSVFKNILLNGQSNNRQLAVSLFLFLQAKNKTLFSTQKFSVSLILLLGNFVHPQAIINELIDDQFQYYNYRIQLELLAIVTATIIKYRQQHYDNLPNIYKHFLPMLISNRRELRHGAMECFTVICTNFNSYKPLTLAVIETNPSIKLLLSLVGNLSHDALNALRFRLQRNILPSLTDEGNITPGLVCDSTTINDPDAKFIVLVNNNSAPTPQPINNNTDVSSGQLSATKISTNSSKLLQLAMPFATKKTNTNDAVRTII